MSYKTYRSSQIILATDADNIVPLDVLTLKHDERHLRRKLLHFDNGDMIMVDLKATIQLQNGDILQAETGESFKIQAASEPLYEIEAHSPLYLLELAWHLGNRHLAVQIFADKITIMRDTLIGDMLIGLGAKLTEIEAPFQPLHGAYHAHHH